MKQKAITAVALAASFGAGWQAAPKHIEPKAINPAIIKLGEENQEALDRYRRGIHTTRTDERSGATACECESNSSVLDSSSTSRKVPIRR